VNAEQIGERLLLLRTRRPLVHHLTNQVTMRDVADATLAAGALPVMALAVDEIEEIVASAQALALNLGTPTRERVEVMVMAGKAANARGVPVVLDPVGAGASAFRTDAARRVLAAVRASIIRANRGEAAALLGVEGTMRGVESGGTGLPAGVLAGRLARQFGTTAAVTGARDHVSDGRQTWAIDNGHPLLARITGGGDVATAIVAAFAAVESDGPLAAVCGLVMLGVAAEIAVPQARGPGSFRIALLDALAAVTPEALVERARVREAEQAWT
jgi:hydroxyethylthiazole kinase